MFVLQDSDMSNYFNDGFYTGESYVLNGERFACVDRDIKKAKIYKTREGAEKGSKIEFSNYSFKVVEVKG